MIPNRSSGNALMISRSRYFACVIRSGGRSVARILLETSKSISTSLPEPVMSLGIVLIYGRAPAMMSKTSAAINSICFHTLRCGERCTACGSFALLPSIIWSICRFFRAARINSPAAKITAGITNSSQRGSTNFIISLLYLSGISFPVLENIIISRQKSSPPKWINPEKIMTSHQR